MLNAPILVQSPDYVALDHLLAHKALVAKHLVIVLLAIGQPLALIMPFAQEGPLAAGANKMVDVKVFTQGSHDSFLDWPPTSAANRYAHFVVTLETVEVLFNLACVRAKLDTTIAAVEMVSVIWFALCEIVQQERLQAR